MNVVIVESPAKAKTINKYLGPDYTVLASYGHIRDLPSKNGSVEPDDDFAMTWAVDSKSSKHVNEIVRAVKGADHLFIASDPDREGEAIAWHVLEVLGDKKALKDVTVKRVVFNEITKKAVQEAFNHPRDIDMELVDAYLARRALDYLVGFTLSPVLWRKLPGSRSAGRVQSVALRLICDREMEIEKFDPQEYWSVDADFTTPDGSKVTTHLTHLDGKKLGKMDIGNEMTALAAKATIKSGTHSVVNIEKKQVRRNPAPPFTTSTLQQEAARKLHFAARRTMQTAQRLYEGVSIDGETVGLITYMRTDGVTMSGEAIDAARKMIGEDFGAKYVPDEPRVYKTKSKNAQEAHEAIRPTDMTRKPDQVKHYLDDDQMRLYELVWKRAIASQVASAVLDQVAVDVETNKKDAMLRVTGSVVAFDGFFRIYREGGDDTENDHRADERDKILPPMNVGDAMTLGEVRPEQHFTQPPPRYSEASLVKKLEELGIGRPSTYASILSVLQDRKYVVLESRRFIPEDRGRLVIAFLESFFSRYIEYDFTADLEDKLDEIAAGNIQWKDLLKDFWLAFRQSVDDIAHLRVREVLDALNDLLGPHLFHDEKNGKNPRACPSCDEGELSLKIGKFGAFIGCSNYPDCKYTRALVASSDDEVAAGIVDGQPKVLGQDPDTGEDVTLRKGPYGFYLQRGEEHEVDGKKVKPKRGSIPQGTPPQDIDMPKALGLLSLPRDVGEHPETREMIKAGIGRFGPFLLYQTVYYSLKDDDPLSIGLNRAVTIIAESPKKPPKHMGDHPEDGKPIMLQKGRWGYFVKHGTIKMNLPRGTEEADVTFDMALAAITAKREKDGKPVKKKAAKKKAAKKKATKKKAAKKKTATKKKAAAKKKENAPAGE